MRALRLSLKLLAATLVVVLALAAALWLWSGSGDSLATLLTRLQRFLPAGQTLEAKEVQGSLRAGGHIGWLRWSQGELSVEAQDIGVAWTLRPLFNKQLRLSELTIASIKIDDHRPKTESVPPTPPTDLRLPITVDVPFKVGSISWSGATSVQAKDISGRYRFDGKSHALEEGRGQIASGGYQLSGKLQATAPMALQLQLQGLVETTVPSSQQHVSVAANAQLAGELAGPDAALTLRASLTPELPANPTAPAAKSQVMQADLSAQIAPWQAQPLTQAKAQWQALNLAALWPQAPLTDLSGEASVTPAGTAWQGKVNVTNALPGPWNQQRLPLNTLQAEVAYDHAQWALNSVQATIAGGTLTGSGQSSAGQWLGNIKLSSVNPGDIDTRLASAAMNGELQARQTPQGLRFGAQLQAAPDKGQAAKSSQAPVSLQTLPLQSLQADGVWAAPQLTLSQLRVDAQEALLEGHLAYNLNTQATQGKLALTLPGLKASLDGLMASKEGKGTLAVNMTDANLASQWFKRWPAVSVVLKGARVQGSAQFDGRWSGGWQQQGRALQIDASLRAPQLDWRSSAASQADPASDVRLQDLQADLSGTLPALTFSTQGRADIGSKKLDWQAQTSAALIKAGHWQMSLNQLKLGAQDSARAGQWTLQTSAATSQSILLDWLTTGLDMALTVSPGSARLQGPQPGEATLSWEPVRWSQQGVEAAKSAKPKAQWQSRGQISKLPLAWLDALSDKTLADLGLSSDLILAGQWEAKQTDSLHLSAMLERSSGDLRLRADDSRQLVLPADMREARLEFHLDDGYLSSSLRWDSARAGKALMAFSTQLQPLGQGWTLARNVPIGGGLQIQMPPVDAWSALAPPGWRLRGTMDADITVSGTLDLPQWDGTLRARDLAVRSVVDGIDFSQGTLNATLHGQQMDIQDFTLQGASASKAGGGGQLSLNGSVFWLPASTEANFLSRLRMAFDVQAKALNLSSRSDRRLVMSGKVAAQLIDARLTLRGTLAADQALILLPEDTAPQLGDDVVLRTAPVKETPQQQQAALTKTTSTAASVGSPRLVSDLLIELDLGPDFKLRGRGLDTRLAGKLSLHAVDNERPNLTGTVRAVRGTYRAYGQRLDIERGLLRFVGPVDNPMLDILAIRPKLSQRVGVQISGSALSPIVRLYAEPELPESEKLAWLVLGRSASDSGGEAALLQQAALALLGGQGKGPSASITQALGLDELSFKNSGANNTATGATVTLGKRLSNDFYVAYESGLAGSMGVFTIFYDLTRRLTLRAQTGEQSAVDLIWTLRYD